MRNITIMEHDDLLPISALQHLAYCPRQCALIHIEQAWAENVFTAEGRILHERAHDGGDTAQGDLFIARGLALCSHQLGLVGIADIVEFHRAPAPAHDAVSLPSRRGLWHPFPVEYKRGRPKSTACDEVQVCAQAMCLEEQLGVPIPEGALYYGQPHRRTPVHFTANLRDETTDLAKRLHELIAAGITPPPLNDQRCTQCSLREHCLPHAQSHASAWLRRQLQDILQDTPETTP